jgi:glycosyltransferase involved in cell wall biosynthesis
MSNTLKGIRIARVSTIPFFVFTQLRSQLENLAAAEAEVYIVTSNEDPLECLENIKGCNFRPIFIAREISLFADMKALIKLWRLFRKERFHIVHSTTPKAGLLCALAAKCAGVPVCIHTFTGQAWVTMTGFKKKVVQWSDKLIAKLNPVSYTDSFSQRDFLIKNNIISADKIKVIGSGSLAGVDVDRFSLKRFTELDKAQLKASLNIDPKAKVLLFVGRVTKEKGIFELLEAVKQVIQKGHDITLMVIGPFEQNNEQEIRDCAQGLGKDSIRFLGFQTEPERYMAITDLLCLPSYREGFGTVVIEAAAMEVPVVGTNIYGLTDAVVNEVTGILVEPKNSVQLADAIEKMVADDPLRMRLGMQAWERAISKFDSSRYNELLIQEYKQLLSNVKSNKLS